MSAAKELSRSGNNRVVCLDTKTADGWETTVGYPIDTSYSQRLHVLAPVDRDVMYNAKPCTCEETS